MTAEAEAQLRAVYDARLDAARRKHVPVPGMRLGERALYFLVGDEPTERDVSLQRPFTGQMNDVLVAAISSMTEKYGCSPDEFYVTYLVKCRFRPEDLTEKQIMEEWLPLLQIEYALSGCQTVACIGKTARLFAPHVQHLPAGLVVAASQPRMSLRDRLAKAWLILTA